MRRTRPTAPVGPLAGRAHGTMSHNTASSATAYITRSMLVVLAGFALTIGSGLAHSTGPVTGGADWICAQPDHWVFANTGMKLCDGIPGLVGWEWKCLEGRDESLC